MIDTKKFVPHSEDPILSLSAAGRLIGKTHTTIKRWVDAGLLNATKDARGFIRVRKSEIVRFAGDK